MLALAPPYHTPADRARTADLISPNIFGSATSSLISSLDLKKAEHKKVLGKKLWEKMLVTRAKRTFTEFVWIFLLCNIVLEVFYNIKNKVFLLQPFLVNDLTRIIWVYYEIAMVA